MTTPRGADQPLLTPAVVAHAMWAQDSASRAAGMQLVAVDRGRAILRLVVGAPHVNGLGVCHGGYVFMLADSAMAFATNSDNQVALAAAAQIEFLRPAVLGDTLEAVATVRSSGKRTAICDVEVRRASSQHDPSAAEGGEAPLLALMRGRTSRTNAQVISD